MSKLKSDLHDNIVNYEKMTLEEEVYLKLREAEKEIKESDVRYSSQDVREAVEKVIWGK